jgi:protein-tyrosine phosphatase
MLHLLSEAGLSQRFTIDSAGTGAYHVGEPADARSAAEARRRGVELPSRARQFTTTDFDRFDYVVAMDRRNQRDLARLARTAADEAKIYLLRSFDERKGADLDVPDPYYGEGDGFARVFDICEAGCRGLLARLRAEAGV